MRKTLIVITLCLLSAFVSHRATMYNLNIEIETDGDGDSAIVTYFGQSDLYGINGYTVE